MQSQLPSNSIAKEIRGKVPIIIDNKRSLLTYSDRNEESAII